MSGTHSCAKVPKHSSWGKYAHSGQRLTVLCLFRLARDCWVFCPPYRGGDAEASAEAVPGLVIKNRVERKRNTMRAQEQEIRNINKACCTDTYLLQCGHGPCCSSRLQFWPMLQFWLWPSGLSPFFSFGPFGAFAVRGDSRGAWLLRVQFRAPGVARRVWFDDGSWATPWAPVEWWA